MTKNMTQKFFFQDFYLQKKSFVQVYERSLEP